MNPYIKNNNLVIPVNCDQKYKYWAGGQSILETLKELEAPEEVVKKYTHHGGMKKNG